MVGFEVVARSIETGHLQEVADDPSKCELPKDQTNTRIEPQAITADKGNYC